MRNAPNLREEYDIREAELLNGKQWQLDLLKKNPYYTCWGNYEDYMSDKDAGWRSPVELESFKEAFELDDYNELVNFYFEVYRKNHTCPHCDGENLNPETKKLSDEWYDFEGTGRRWCNDLTEVEVEALIRGGRLTDLTGNNWYNYDEEKQSWMVMDRTAPFNLRQWVECEQPEFPTPEQVNSWNRGPGMGHDAINRWICVKARAKHLGVYGECEHCEGGNIYDEPEARVGLQLWMLHPREGCSRGVYIKNIDENEVPEVLEYLKNAARRNAQRFENL